MLPVAERKVLGLFRANVGTRLGPQEGAVGTGTLLLPTVEELPGPWPWGAGPKECHQLRPHALDAWELSPSIGSRRNLNTLDCMGFLILFHVFSPFSPWSFSGFVIQENHSTSSLSLLTMSCVCC